MDEICGYVSVSGRRVHYRRAGQGPAMVMMHASPLSSASLRPAMAVSGQHFTCFALDNPGFGLSDPLPTRQGDIMAQADALKDAIMVLGLSNPIVYGASTGAAIAHAFSVRHPDAARLIVLDSFSHHDTQDMMEGYFPDVRPQRDGRHLLAIWEKICGLYLFSPWQKAEAGRRQVRTMPTPQFLHAMALELMIAGDNYSPLYKAAIAWEDKDNINKAKAPTFLNLWASASGIDRVQMLVDLGLNDTITPVTSPAGVPGRYTAMLAALMEAGYGQGDAVPAPILTQRFFGDYKAGYIASLSGQLHAHGRLDGDGRPLIMLHDAGCSSHSFAPFGAVLAQSRPVLAIDLPGHGDSLVPPQETIAGHAACLKEALSGLDFGAVDVLATGAGLAVAAALKDSGPGQVHSLMHLASRPIPASAPPEGVFTFTPDMVGSHLIKAYGQAKYEALFWPAWDRRAQTALSRPQPFEPGVLHRRAIDLLKAGESSAALYREAAAIDVAGHIDIHLVPQWRLGDVPLAQGDDFRGQTCQPLPADAHLWADALSAMAAEARS
ncbi:MAG: alpha/beta fold hydrolase [Pseudomonadota bacterium]